MARKSKTIGILNDSLVRWEPGDERPYIENEGRRRYIAGVPVEFSTTVEGVPEITDADQVGAIGCWGAVFKLYENSMWQANCIRGEWSLVPA